MLRHFKECLTRKKYNMNIIKIQWSMKVEHKKINKNWILKIFNNIITPKMSKLFLVISGLLSFVRVQQYNDDYVISGDKVLLFGIFSINKSCVCRSFTEDERYF